MTGMPEDFFGSVYVECERAGDHRGWLDSEGINPRAWISFFDFLKSEARDAILSGQIDGDGATDALIASAMQTAWVGARKWAAHEQAGT